MRQIINSPTSVCLSSLIRSQFSLDFDESSHRSLNPNHKIEFVGVKIWPFLLQFFTPTVHCQWQGLNTTVEPCAQIVVFYSSKNTSHQPLYSRYTGDGEQCSNSVLFSHKVTWNYSVTAMVDCVRFRNHKFNSFSRMWSIIFRLACFSTFMGNLDTAMMLYVCQQF